jgi:hypothetical protein
MKRLPLVLSLVALVVALMGATSLGQAASGALPFARNADRVDEIHASKTPRAGQLYPLGTNGKFPARVVSVTKGPKGDTGFIGTTSVVSAEFAVPAGTTGPVQTVACPAGTGVISGGIVSMTAGDTWVNAQSGNGWAGAANTSKARSAGRFVSMRSVPKVHPRRRQHPLPRFCGPRQPQLRRIISPTSDQAYVR